MIMATALFIWVWLFVLNAFCAEIPYQPASALSQPALFLFISLRFFFVFYRPLDLTEAVPRITETSSHLSLGHCAQCRERGVMWEGNTRRWREPAHCKGISEKQDSLLTHFQTQK